MNSSDLNSSEYNSYYQQYITILGDVNLLKSLKDGLTSLENFITGIPNEKFAYAYDKGKWSVAEVLVHLIDTERVFQYRALRFARNDKTSIPGFDQDSYVSSSRANSRKKESILAEYKAVRKSSITLFESFDNEELERFGIASGSKMSVRALGFIISGHLKHHKNIIEERYL